MYMYNKKINAFIYAYWLWGLSSLLSSWHQRHFGGGVKQLEHKASTGLRPVLKWTVFGLQFPISLHGVMLN
jgi:hypothetical protein